MSNDNTLENFILPFQIESANLRGRIVKLGNELDDILTAHNYPDGIDDLVGQIQIATVLLSSMMKFEGVFTLQARGDGVVSMLVSDMTSNGDIRSCASFDSDAIANSPVKGGSLGLLGDGHMAFTVDHAGMKDRYQGIVALQGDSLVESIQHYFKQSEQIKTGLKIVVEKIDGRWIGAGIMVQALPEDLKTPANDTDSNHYADSWDRAMALLGSCSNAELLSDDLPASDLLFRLFHEDGVRVYPYQQVQKNCRCDQERVKNVVSSLDPEEQNHLVKGGSIEVKCEFCSKIYKIDPKTL